MAFKVSVFHKSTGDFLHCYEKINLRGLNYKIPIQEIEHEVWDLLIQDGKVIADEKIDNFKFVVEEF
jgi:hypothetical protein